MATEPNTVSTYDVNNIRKDFADPLPTQIELMTAIQHYFTAVLDNEGVHFIGDIADDRSRAIVQQIYDTWAKQA